MYREYSNTLFCMNPSQYIGYRLYKAEHVFMLKYQFFPTLLTDICSFIDFYLYVDFYHSVREHVTHLIDYDNDDEIVYSLKSLPFEVP